MSQRGDWGDKTIITLPSDGVRRHKTWCVNYCTGGHCILLNGKCRGSSFCRYYKSNMREEGTFSFPEPTPTPTPTPAPAQGAEEEKSRVVYKEHYRLAGWGDKLIHKTVLLRKTWFRFRIGVVTDEDFRTFTVEYDGEKHKFDKHAAYKGRSVYIFVESERVEENL